MIRIAVCDNDVRDLEVVCGCIREYFDAYKRAQGALYTFTSGEELLAEAKRQPFDAYFLDIIMPGLNGMEIGRSIRAWDARAPIVYITTSREFAFEAYGVRAMNYLEKPADRREVFRLLDMIERFCEKYKKVQISIHTKQGLTTVDPGDILYVENVSRQAVYTLRDGTEVAGVCNRGAFEETVRPLAEHADFIQPHKSFFVNMNYIRTLSTDKFILDSGKEIAVSRKRMAETKKAYLKFLAKGGECL